MILVADIGNTSTTVGVFDGEKLIADFKLASDKKRSEDEYGIILSNFMQYLNPQNSINLDGAIISSVVLPLTERFKTAFEKYLKIDCIVVNHKIKTGVELAVDKPEEVGADRIVNAYAAAELYSSPAIVVDFGTATSFDVIKNKKFVGGIIAAGMKIQADALANFTSKLPKVKIEAPTTTIATNTINSMLSGIVRGHARMIDGLLEDCEKELGQKAFIIATGGYSEIISKYLKRKFDVINPNLTLVGLRMLYDLNVR